MCKSCVKSNQYYLEKTLKKFSDRLENRLIAIAQWQTKRKKNAI